jgi:hypothetical protein
MDPDHDTNMIDNLRQHIRESLSGIPNDLPELKGVRAKLPEAYEGDDDFDRLDKWLQGLLRFFKLHRLTGAEKDRDRILVTGTSLKGKAERWFSHEVERPTRIIRNWTFESVIVGLFRTFITTATAQQAMQRYAQVRFSREEGIMAFYRDLLMWAGRLAQYPDPYSFKRRLLNGMPSEYRHHLALYDGVSAEHSSIDEIVQKARHLEKTLTSLRSGRGADKQHTPNAPVPTGNGQHKAVRPQYNQRPRNEPTRPRQQPRAELNTGTQARRPTQRPADGGKTAATNQPVPRSDTSKLTCYKCGKTGHISSDPKCPQYKKPEQRQLFAAQVLDDRSDGDPPDQDESLEGQEQVQEPEVEKDLEEDELDDNPDGSQYDDEGSSYDEYAGYAPPSEDEELEYIRAMSDDASSSSTLFDSSESSTSDASSDQPPNTQFESVDWQSRLQAIRSCYQRAPWVRGAAWEFTPRDGITHIRNCEWCAKYKEHLFIAEAMRDAGMEHKDDSAWTIRDQYEQKLIRLGWDLAHEGGRLPEPEVNAIRALEERNHQLQIQLEGWRKAALDAAKERMELIEELDCERLDASLRGGEADFWQSQYEYIQQEYFKLEEKLLGLHPMRTPPVTDDDVQMRSTTPGCKTPEQPDPDGPDDSLNVGVRIPPRNEPTRLRHPTINDDEVARIAVVRDDTNAAPEREFRAAQRRTYENGERPKTSGSDRRCMAALVKVNGLEAYTLLDSGSTTVSITHDFARVAKLKVMQLERPIPLQLGTVGSRSMINFGTRTRVELGPIKVDDAYMDVVNIDRYDMIIGTPFMRKHGLVLDFGTNTLANQGEIIPTLTAGQEDLMLAKKRATRARDPSTNKGRPPHVSQ